MIIKSLKIVLVIICVVTFFDVQADNWPRWRGEKGDGTCNEVNIPTKWDTITNIKWKVTYPGTGYGSPIVWNDRLFMITALEDSNRKMLLCFDTKNGNILWQSTVLVKPFEGKHNDNSFASGTPSTDGKNVYVSFLDGDSVLVAAYDFEGNQLWAKRPGSFSSPHGYSCSPVIYKDMVIINGNSKGDSFMAALSRSDGHTIWKVLHPNAAHSFSTPIFREIGGKMQMIFLGNKEVASYNPEDGSKYWYVSGPSEDFTASPVYNEKSGLVLISSAWPQRHLLAINPDGQGDVTGSKVVWRSTEGAYYVPSPVTVDNYLLSTMTSGVVHCIEASTGKILWKENLGKQYASPVLVNGLVYMPNDQGIITIIKPGPTFRVISKNSIGEMMFASPAISNSRIYIRGTRHLFAIGE